MDKGRTERDSDDRFDRDVDWGLFRSTLRHYYGIDAEEFETTPIRDLERYRSDTARLDARHAIWRYNAIGATMRGREAEQTLSEWEDLASGDAPSIAADEEEMSRDEWIRKFYMLGMLPEWMLDEVGQKNGNGQAWQPDS